MSLEKRVDVNVTRAPIVNEEKKEIEIDEIKKKYEYFAWIPLFLVEKKNCIQFAGK